MSLTQMFIYLFVWYVGVNCVVFLQQRTTGPSKNPAVLLEIDMDTSLSSIESLEVTQITYKPDTD